MGFFDHKHEKESPIGNLRAHIGTFMYFVKVGKSKFKNKGRVGEIFADMDNTQYLFQQATSGTMYDMKKNWIMLCGMQLSINIQKTSASSRRSF